MKEKIFNNVALKVLSALCAVILWAVIVNIYDPTASVTISNVTVQLINAESLTDKNYTYEVVDGEKISVYLSGPKSVITDIKSSDIVATADLSKISAFADYVDIDVKVVKEGRVLQNVDVSPRTSAVKLNIENRLTEEFKVTPEIIGSVAEGYKIISQSVTPGTIKITGATSSIEHIDDVRAVFDISGATRDVSGNAAIVIYDMDGNEYTDGKFELSATEVTVNVTVDKVKEVPVKIEGTTGKVASGYILDKYESKTASVTLTGDSQVLSDIEQIVIPSQALNIEGFNENNKAVEVDISKYIPSGATLIGNKLIKVEFTILQSEDKTVSLDKSKITIDNQPQGLNIVAGLEGTLNIIVSGSADTLSKINADSIKARINLVGLESGESEVRVDFELPQGVVLSGEYFIMVELGVQEQ